MSNVIGGYSKLFASKADNTSFSVSLRDSKISSAFFVSAAFSSSFEVVVSAY
jgi:hypothetical protein